MRGLNLYTFSRVKLVNCIRWLSGKEAAYRYRRYKIHGFNSLAWGYLLEKDVPTHSSNYCQQNPMDRGDWQAVIHRITKIWT